LEKGEDNPLLIKKKKKEVGTPSKLRRSKRERREGSPFYL